MHEIVEDQQDKETRASEVDDKFVRWEALRALVNTIGARDALAVALTQVKGGQP